MLVKVIDSRCKAELSLTWDCHIGQRTQRHALSHARLVMCWTERESAPHLLFPVPSEAHFLCWLWIINEASIKRSQCSWLSAAPFTLLFHYVSYRCPRLSETGTKAVSLTDQKCILYHSLTESWGGHGPHDHPMNESSEEMSRSLFLFFWLILLFFFLFPFLLNFLFPSFLMHSPPLWRHPPLFLFLPLPFCILLSLSLFQFSSI